MNNVLEEAKKCFMEKLHKDAYEKEYLRDSNGHLKANAKKFGQN